MKSPRQYEDSFYFVKVGLIGLLVSVLCAI